MSPLPGIQAIDYTVIFARDMAAMRDFYERVMGFTLTRTLSANWLEFTLGAQTLALATPGTMWPDAAPPKGQLSLQLAFRVAPDQVVACAREIQARGVTLERPVTDHDFGHRTVFFRDPDGNILEIYAEIAPG